MKGRNKIGSQEGRVHVRRIVAPQTMPNRVFTKLDLVRYHSYSFLTLHVMHIVSLDVIGEQRRQQGMLGHV